MEKYGNHISIVLLPLLTISQPHRWKYFVEDGCLNVTGEFFIDSNGGIIAEYVPFSAKFKVNPGRRFPYQLIYLYMNI